MLGQKSTIWDKNLKNYFYFYFLTNCETKSGLLPRFCFLNVSQLWGLTLNLGVTPKSALNDGQKWFSVRHSKIGR